MLLAHPGIISVSGKVHRILPYIFMLVTESIVLFLSVDLFIYLFNFFFFFFQFLFLCGLVRLRHYRSEDRQDV